MNRPHLFPVGPVGALLLACMLGCADGPRGPMDTPSDTAGGDPPDLVIAFESDLYACYQADRRAGTLTAESFMYHCPYVYGTHTRSPRSSSTSREPGERSTP